MTRAWTMLTHSAAFHLYNIMDNPGSGHLDWFSIILGGFRDGNLQQAMRTQFHFLPVHDMIIFSSHFTLDNLWSR